MKNKSLTSLNATNCNMDQQGQGEGGEEAGGEGKGERKQQILMFITFFSSALLKRYSDSTLGCGLGKCFFRAIFRISLTQSDSPIRTNDLVGTGQPCSTGNRQRAGTGGGGERRADYL